MEPLNDKELKQLLNMWEAPVPPLTLVQRVLPERMPWWQWLFTGSIRIPVPVGIAAIVGLLIWMLFSKPASPPAPVVHAPVPSTLADFQPVDQLQPTIERKQ
jgi:hypothetical protein